MRTRVVRMGNTRVIRLPKDLLDQAEIKDEVDVQAEQGRIIIRPAPKFGARAREVARRLRSAGPPGDAPDGGD